MYSAIRVAHEGPFFSDLPQVVWDEIDPRPAKGTLPKTAWAPNTQIFQGPLSARGLAIVPVWASPECTSFHKPPTTMSSVWCEQYGHDVATPDPVCRRCGQHIQRLLREGL